MPLSLNLGILTSCNLLDHSGPVTGFLYLYLCITRINDYVSFPFLNWGWKWKMSEKFGIIIIFNYKLTTGQVHLKHPGSSNSISSSGSSSSSSSISSGGNSSSCCCCCCWWSCSSGRRNEILYLNFRNMSSFKPVVSNKTLFFYNHKINIQFWKKPEFGRRIFNRFSHIN